MSLLLFGGLSLLSSVIAPPVFGQPYEGFGASTPGGTGGVIVRVTNLNDAGPGSFREAVSGGSRTVVFDVAGDIVLSDHVYVSGAFITIDGFTAPVPGITLKNRGLIIRGSRGAHDVIVRGIRVRNASIDGIQIAYRAYNVVIDHVSVQGSLDGNLDITEDARDVVVSWSIFAQPADPQKNMLIKYRPSRITLHHNVFISATQRNPLISIDDTGTPATDTTADMRNNVVWDWGPGHGTMVRNRAQVNVVDNFFAAAGGDAKDALIVDHATVPRVHTSGNVSADGFSVAINALGREPTPFPAPSVTTTEPCIAAHAVIAGAGVRPLDAIDQQYLGRVTLPACATAAPTLTAVPSALNFRLPQDSGASPPQAVTVRDVAGRPLTWSLPAIPAPWLAVAPLVGTAPGSLLVQTDATGLAPGVYTASIRIEAPTATNKAIDVPITLTVQPAAVQGGQFIRLSPGSPADDGFQYAAHPARTRDSWLRLGRGYLVAMRFQNVPIPPGAIIESAVLWVYAGSGSSTDVRLRYAAETVDTSPPILDQAQNLSRRARTFAAIDDVPGPWTPGYNSTPDLSRILQEVIDRAGWQAGNDLTLLIADNGSPRIRLVGAVESAHPIVLDVTFRVP